MDGDVHERAEAFVRMLLANRSPGTRKALLAGGELTLRVTGKGKGGRSQEFALVAARALALAGARASGVAVLASGTDGTDGPTDAAGAIVDGLTVARAERLGLDTEELLRDNDSYSYFDGLGDLLKTGPTGTNVNDLVVGLTTG
jgi:glycerate-2-kinase